MCGIVVQAGAPLAEPARRAAALARLRHRGPDAQGEWLAPDGGVWLAHRRLAIVDLSAAGAQPLVGEDGGVVLVCNGEIYNAPLLRPLLEGLGHRFRSRSDNEVILHAWEEWGEGALERLEGMFAFVVWDGGRGTLTAVRDRLGIKPLYWVALNGGGIALASESTALLPLLGEAPPPEPLALAYLLTMGHVPAPWSIWRGMRRLGGGELLRWRPGGEPRVAVWWEPPRALEGGGDRRREAFAERFEPILRQHLMADVPVGLFLSAGLDSSTVALGLRRLGQPLEAFTVHYPGDARDEARLARETADRLELPFQEVALPGEEVEGWLNAVARGVDEPQGHGGYLPVFAVSRAAAARYKVVLAGDGGDELFGGYPRYRELLHHHPRRSWWVRRGLRPLVARGASPALRQRAAYHFARCSVLHRHAWFTYPRFLPEEARALLAPMGLHFDDEEFLEPLRRHWEPALPVRRALQRLDLMTYLGENNLAKVDRASMAHSLEVRVPLADRRLAEWALTLPLEEREEREGKPVLREYLAGEVPPGVFTQRKQGFSLRTAHRFGWERAMGEIRAGVWVRGGYWAAEWERLVAPGVPYREGRLWSLLMLTRWADCHLSGGEGPGGPQR